MTNVEEGISPETVASYQELLHILAEINAVLGGLAGQVGTFYSILGSVGSVASGIGTVVFGYLDYTRALEEARGRSEELKRVTEILNSGFGGLKSSLDRIEDKMRSTSHACEGAAEKFGKAEKDSKQLNVELRKTGDAGSQAAQGIEKAGDKAAQADKRVSKLSASFKGMGHGVTGSLSNMSYAFMALGPMMNTIGEQGADGFLDSFKGSLEKAKTEGPGLIGEIGQAISGAVTLLVESAGSLMASLGGAITSTLPVLLEAAGNLFGGIVQSLGDIVVPLAESFGGVMQSFFEHVGTLVPALLEAALNFFTTIVNSLEQIVGPLLDALPTVVTAVVNALPTFVSTLLSAATTLFMAIAEAVPGILTSLLAAVGDLVGKGIDYVAEKADDMLQAGKDLIGGLVDGIRDAAGRVLDAIGGVVNDAIDWAKSLLGIHSPSTVFKGIGGNLSQGFADGIASKAAVAAGAMKDLVDDVALAAKMPTLDVSAGMAAAAGMMGGLGYARGFGGAASGAVTNYYIDGVDLSSSPAAMKAAEQLWGDVRRQIRIGVR